MRLFRCMLLASRFGIEQLLLSFDSTNVVSPILASRYGLMRPCFEIPVGELWLYANAVPLEFQVGLLQIPLSQIKFASNSRCPTCDRRLVHFGERLGYPFRGAFVARLCRAGSVQHCLGTHGKLAHIRFRLARLERFAMSGGGMGCVKGSLGVASNAAMG